MPEKEDNDPIYDELDEKVSMTPKEAVILAIGCLAIGLGVGWLAQVLEVKSLVLSAGEAFSGFMERTFGLRHFEWAITFCVWIIGTLLYGFRCRRPKWYGRLEILAGLFIATFVASSAISHFDSAKGSTAGIGPHLTATLVAILGALYIIVRGYDNIYRSLTPESPEIKRWNYLHYGQKTGQRL